MTNASTIAAEIMLRLPDVRSGSLSVFGDIFGGRIDNIHAVKLARATEEPERLVVDFRRGNP